jgi:hypothetical protein
MTVFEAVSPTVNEPIDSMFYDSEYAYWMEQCALDRWTNEGGALYDSRFAPQCRGTLSREPFGFDQAVYEDVPQMRFYERPKRPT